MAGPVRIEPDFVRVADTPVLPAGRKDILYSLDVPTRHVAWGTPYYLGTLKTFVLSPIVPNGDATELLKRFDTDHWCVSCDWSWEMNTWGMGDAYGQRSGKEAHGRDLEFGYMAEDLTGSRPFDVMVMPTVIGWNWYPEAARNAIIERVKSGAGLVLISPQNEKEEKPADTIVMPLAPIKFKNPTNYHWYGDWQRHVGRIEDGAAWKPAGRHFITDGVPLDAFPFADISYSEAEAGPEATVVLATDKGVPIIAVRALGKGRIVAINWYTHQSGLTPDESTRKPLPDYDYWEYFYSLLGRSCLWAAHRESAVAVTSVTSDKKEYAPAETGKGVITVALDNTGRELAADLEATFHNASGSQIAKVSAAVKPGASTVTIPMPAGLPGGPVLCDVLVNCSAYRVNWGSTLFTVKQPVRIDKVTVGPAAVKNGATVKGAAQLVCTQAGAGTVVCELRDPYDRIVAAVTREADFSANLEVPFEFTVDNWLALVGFVRVKAVQSGAILFQADSNDFTVTPVEPGFTDYEVAPWGLTARRNLWDVKAAQFKAMAATSQGDISPKALRYGFSGKGVIGLETLGIYYYNQARQQLQDRWDAYKKSGMTAEDKQKLLCRDFCLSKPDVRAKEQERIRAKVGEQVQYNPGTYYIGDESSLTSYGMEAELCYTPECLANFRAWLKARYATLDALNRKWKTTYKDFAEIVPPSIVEAQRDKTFIPWAEHRTFMEWLYADNLKLVRETVKAIDPIGEVEFTGTQAPTSFDGMDWARHMAHVKRYVPYSGNFMWDMCRSFQPDVKMVGLTGYGSHGDGLQYSLWQQAFHGLTGINIFWEWSLVDADLTLSQNAEDIGAVARQLRGDGIGRLLTTLRWMPNDIAIHYSMPSIHAARLLNAEGRPTACRNGFGQLASDLMYQFDMISYLQVEEGRLNAAQDRPGYKVLILPCALAVSVREAAEMRKFAEAGGVIIADADCGQFDDLCDDGVKPLKDLFDTGTPGAVKKVGKGTTVYLGKTIEWYPDKRSTPEGEALRAEMDKLFAGYGAKRPFDVRLADGGAPLPQAEAFYLTNGTFRCIGLLKENLGGKHYRTPDGVEYFVPFDDDTPKPVDKVNVGLNGTWHVYDVRTRAYLGSLDTLETTITSAEAKLFTLLPYKVAAVDVKLTGAPRAGACLDAAVRLETDKPAATHVFNVTVFGPDGARITCYDRNIVAPGGTAAFKLPLALNAAAGTWKLVVRDVASGVEAAVPVQVAAE